MAMTYLALPRYDLGSLWCILKMTVPVTPSTKVSRLLQKYSLNIPQYDLDHSMCTITYPDGVQLAENPTTGGPTIHPPLYRLSTMLVVPYRL